MKTPYDFFSVDLNLAANVGSSIQLVAKQKGVTSFCVLSLSGGGTFNIRIGQTGAPFPAQTNLAWDADDPCQPETDGLYFDNPVAVPGGVAEILVFYGGGSAQVN